MKHACLALLACLAIAAAAHGQAIDGPDTVAPSTPAWFAITNLPEHAKAAWYPNAELQAGPPHIQSGHALFFATTPGTRTLSAMVAIVDADGRLQDLVPITKTVQVTADDNQNPPPPPTPAGQRQLILIWESGVPTPATATAANSRELKEYLTAHKHHLWMTDQHAVGPDGKTAPAGLADYLALAKKKTLPHLFIVAASSGGGSGDIVWQGQPPATASEWLALIQKHGG
jgi:hypothetical protein